MLTHKKRINLLVAASIAAMLALLALGPIAQDPAYHRFADATPLAGIPNFWNVMSNLAFVFVGLLGLGRYRRMAAADSREAYLVICISTVLTGFGSAYYHWAPSNATLLWDRLPMTAAFMALFAMLLGERVIARCGRWCLGLLLCAGIASAVYWAWSESIGQGDLRPYILVQFLPVLLMPLILWLFPARFLNDARLLAAFGFYLLAKALEHFDGWIWLLGHLMSGHPLKHLAAAAAAFCIIIAVPVRR